MSSASRQWQSRSPEDYEKHFDVEAFSEQVHKVQLWASDVLRATRLHLNHLLTLPFDVYNVCPLSCPVEVLRQLWTLFYVNARFYKDLHDYSVNLADRLALFQETDYTFFPGTICTVTGRVRPDCFTQEEEAKRPAVPSIWRATAILEHLSRPSRFGAKALVDRRQPQISYSALLHLDCYRDIGVTDITSVLSRLTRAELQQFSPDAVKEHADPLLDWDTFVTRFERIERGEQLLDRHLEGFFDAVKELEDMLAWADPNLVLESLHQLHDSSQQPESHQDSPYQRLKGMESVVRQVAEHCRQLSDPSARIGWPLPSFVQGLDSWRMASIEQVYGPFESWALFNERPPRYRERYYALIKSRSKSAYQVVRQPERLSRAVR